MTGSAENSSAGRLFWKLVDAGEPFRLLFPLGALLGIVGVAVWPLHVWGGAPNYPGQIHARIMIECFLAAFVTGFLGTALPRVLEVRRIGLLLSGTLAGALVVTAVLHFNGRILWGDVAFVLTIGFFAGILLFRAQQRKDVPPPSFVLVAMGICAALTGAALQIIDRLWPMLLAPWAASLGRILLHQGFLLLPVMVSVLFSSRDFSVCPAARIFPSHPKFRRDGGRMLLSLWLQERWSSRAFFSKRSVMSALHMRFVFLPSRATCSARFPRAKCCADAARSPSA